MKPGDTLKAHPCRAFRIKGALVLVVTKPIRKGWRLAAFTPNRHNNYSVWIEPESSNRGRIRDLDNGKDR